MERLLPRATRTLPMLAHFGRPGTEITPDGPAPSNDKQGFPWCRRFNSATPGESLFLNEYHKNAKWNAAKAPSCWTTEIFSVVASLFNSFVLYMFFRCKPMLSAEQSKRWAIAFCVAHTVSSLYSTYDKQIIFLKLEVIEVFCLRNLCQYIFPFISSNSL